MTVDANAPAIVQQLETQLNATAYWTANGGAAQNHYPSVDWSASLTYPLAVLSLPTESVDRISSDADFLHNGTLELGLVFETDVARAQADALTIRNQMMAATGTGIPIQTINVGDVFEPNEAKKAGGHDKYGIILTIEYGLTGG